MAVQIIPGMTIPAAGGGPKTLTSWITRITNKFLSYKRIVLTDKQLESGTTLILDPAWSGSVVMIETAGITVKLPSLATPANGARYEEEVLAGLHYTIIGAVASAGIILKCNDATSVIKGRLANWGAAYAQPSLVTSTANTGAVTNTGGTAVIGDSIEVVSDGSGIWYIVNSKGIWAVT